MSVFEEKFFHDIVAFRKEPLKSSETALVFVWQGNDLSPAAARLDALSGGALSAWLAGHKAFKGKAGQDLLLPAPEESGFKQIFVFGLGKKETFDGAAAEAAGVKLSAALTRAALESVSVYTEDDGDRLSRENVIRLLIGAGLAAYRFDRYRMPGDKNGDQESESDAPSKVPLKRFDVLTDEKPAAEKLWAVAKAELAGIYLSRDLGNEPANILYPESYAEIIREELKPLGVQVEVLDEKKMQKLGMGGILGVGMGSDRFPRMVVMRWKGGKKSDKPVALVGKGVTFDTGGISIKPAAGMDEMKMDMCGSATVVGTMKTLALRKAKANVVGVVGLAENMPSARSYRPGDILTTYSGKTVEVLNTDAEGRLVLADALTYVQKTEKPEVIIDLATLTGAMMVALGYDYCGVFANNDDLWTEMERAGKASGEKIWRMPLDEIWRKDMVSGIADLQNLGKMGRYGGACTAAGFLEHFIEDGMPWAHMDVAGTAWVRSNKPHCIKGATGFGVRVLNRWIENRYEQ